jgi:signal-transduction protein with cAMP-binding, CBS, and nucleotidyltransferase domain
MRVRLVHQLEQLARGQAPDNRVVPARLSRADALLLRDALRTVSLVQRTVRGRYPEGIG